MATSNSRSRRARERAALTAIHKKQHADLRTKRPIGKHLTEKGVAKRLVAACAALGRAFQGNAERQT